jgi:hypothetical protein
MNMMHVEYDPKAETYRYAPRGLMCVDPSAIGMPIYPGMGKPLAARSGERHAPAVTPRTTSVAATPRTPPRAAPTPPRVAPTAPKAITEAECRALIRKTERLLSQYEDRTEVRSSGATIDNSAELRRLAEREAIARMDRVFGFNQVGGVRHEGTKTTFSPLSPSDAARTIPPTSAPRRAAEGKLVSSPEFAWMDRKMGIEPKVAAVRREGNRTIFSYNA